MNTEKNSSENNLNEVLTDDFKEKVRQKIPVNFDLSIIGKIDLSEAEKIAGEEVIFLTEDDLIEGLEDFELVPIKNIKDETKPIINYIETVISDTGKKTLESENIDETEKIDSQKNIITSEYKNDTISEIPDASYTEKESVIKELPYGLEVQDISDTDIEIIEVDIYNIKKDTIDTKNEVEVQIENLLPEKKELNEFDNKIENSVKTTEIEELKELYELDELTTTKKLFTVKISEKTLDDQLSSILKNESIIKIEDKNLDKFIEDPDLTNCRFIDDHFLNKSVPDEDISYNEDPLTERLVKMIEVADSKLELVEISAKDEEFPKYILEDYTLYSSEKFEIVFKEEIFYQDSDFEFIDNAIIRDDFTKYIHEIDDYFDSEDSISQSEISEILGLIPEEKDVIDEKLFGDYYKKYDLDNEIDFIKPELDFFRRNFSGKKNASYFVSNDANLRDYERISIEEDISSPDAIIFEEDISEIREILIRDYNSDIKSENNKPEDVITVEDAPYSEIEDITDKIIIMEDKEKIMELVSDYPDKHDNLIKLLSYLDGLFEKLPEEVIRKFAESEYFELYSKVLKEMGV